MKPAPTPAKRGVRRTSAAWALTGLLAAAALLAGCTHGPGGPPGHAYGVALQGPTCPVERDPPDPACSDQPYEGPLAAVSDQDGSRVPFTTASDGTFNVTLAPGSYRIVDAQQRGVGSCQSDTFLVASGKATYVAVACDTGIRSPGPSPGGA